jgi:hypothetical protein
LKERLMSSLHGRRSFVSAVASLTGLAVARLSAGQRPAGQPAAAAIAGFDMAWLEQLKGKRNGQQQEDGAGPETPRDHLRLLNHKCRTTAAD